ncbi:MAG: hypothetical protein COA90_05480 [Gammaproteobacteria bacterium]|nr:MAG: hypothetical protein COA90_05480 [Gammaproteobacteria bacterium]
MNSNTTTKQIRIQSHWWSKTFIGSLLGLSLAFFLVGIFAWAGPGGISAENKVQFNMWIITPIWLLLFSTVYLYPTRWHALFYIGGANILAYATLFLVQGFNA